MKLGQNNDVGVMLIAGAALLGLYGFVQSRQRPGGGGGGGDNGGGDNGGGGGGKVLLTQPPLFQAVAGNNSTGNGGNLNIQDAQLVHIGFGYSLVNTGEVQRGIVVEMALKRDIAGPDVEWLRFNSGTGEVDKHPAILPLSVNAGPSGVRHVDPGATANGSFVFSIDGPGAGIDENLAWKAQAVSSLDLFMEVRMLDVPVSFADADQQPYVLFNGAIRPGVHIQVPLFGNNLEVHPAYSVRR